MGSTPVVTKLTGSEATWARESRRLARMGRDIRAERSSGLISTMSPAILTPEDIRVHLTARRSLHYSGSEYSHEVSTLTAICDYCDNPAVRVCLKKYPLLRPVSRHVRLDSLSAADYDRLLDFLLRDGLTGAELRSAAGVPLDYRVLRRTFGQCYIDAGLDVETVSVLMGHSTTRTTEYYYCRRSKSAALQRQSGILDSLAGEKVSAGGGVRTLDLRISLEGSNRSNPMSPTLHQAKPPRHL